MSQTVRPRQRAGLFPGVCDNGALSVILPPMAIMRSSFPALLAEFL
jgi:hypothetical protein